MEHQQEEQRNGVKQDLTMSQKILLSSFYGLLGLMIVFSVIAMQDKGEEGYHKCLQQKCEKKGEKFCSKAREISNCCLGAGGQVASIQNKLTCVFES